MKKLYFTTTLGYVNADPHSGHAVEPVQADAYARYFRSKLGQEHVFFNPGTDEYGLKMVQGDGVIHARSQVPPDLRGVRPEQTGLGLSPRHPA